jgi:hypothetical protein
MRGRTAKSDLGVAKKYKRAILVVSFLCIFCTATNAINTQERYEVSFCVVAQKIRTVFRITPSISTGIEARKTIAYFSWQLAQDPFDADAIFVVVKTFGLRYPLDSFYDSIEDLIDDAEGQMNITGGIVHLYLYSFSKEGLSELAHMRYNEDS